MTNEMKNNLLPARLSELMRNVTGDKPVSIRAILYDAVYKVYKRFHRFITFLAFSFQPLCNLDKV